MPDPTSSPESPSLRVSAILVAYNQCDAARRAIHALEQSKDRERLEILLLDCGSTDGTRTLDTEFPAVQTLRLPHHIGAGRAYNIAARTAKGDFLLFLSANVEVNPETISTLATALDSEPETIAACPLLTSPSGEPTPRVYRLPDPASIASAPLSPASPDLSAPSLIEYPTLDALLVRRAFVQAMNYFDQRYGHYWLDAELGMQARRAGKKMRFIPAATAVYHPAADPVAADPVAISDRIVGAAEYATKYGSSGFTLRFAAAFRALTRFELALFSKLLGSQKIDGSQV